MEEKSTRSSPPAPGPATPGSAEAPRDKSSRDAAWRPRVDNSERTLHGFESHSLEEESLEHPPQVNDPEEDTAPLQGTRDRSDDDSLDGE